MELSIRDARALLGTRAYETAANYVELGDDVGVRKTAGDDKR